MKVGNLSGALLDYWTARAQGISAEVYSPNNHETVCVIENRRNYAPSSDWADGGAIVELFSKSPGNRAAHGYEHYRLVQMQVIGPSLEENAWLGKPNLWICKISHSDGQYGGGTYEMRGDTPLIAIMRAFVAVKFGNEVEA